ncbi:hypothetical protein CL616_05065, partial [archaeon]|nr:hypothetical protein [archaeon]
MGFFSRIASLFKKRTYSMNEAVMAIAEDWRTYISIGSKATKQQFLARVREAADSFLDRHESIREKDMQRIGHVAASKLQKQTPTITDAEYQRSLRTSYNKIKPILKQVLKMSQVYVGSTSFSFLQLRVNLLTEKKRLLIFAKTWKSHNSSYYRFVIERTRELDELCNYLSRFEKKKVTIE